MYINRYLERGLLVHLSDYLTKDVNYRVHVKQKSQCIEVNNHHKVT